MIGQAKQPVRVNDLLKLEIRDVALGGKAVARVDSRVVFVDGALPGDVVDARVSRLKPNYAEARLIRIETPSRDRVPAPCQHVAVCGGCRLQELDYSQQCRLKERQVRDALERIGRLPSFQLDPIQHAPERFRYRNKMEFTVHPAPDGAARIGLHERGTFDRVFAVEDCLLPSELTMRILRATQEAASRHRWQAYHPARHDGIVRFLVVRHLRSTGQCAVGLIAASDSVPGLDAWARTIAALSPEITTITLGINRSRSNIAIAEEELTLVGEGVVVERLLGLEFEATSSTFLQTNSAQAEALYAAVAEAADPRGDESVLDLYCGTGTLTLILARRAREVVGVESVVDAVERARSNAERNGISNARFVAGEARAVLREWARGQRSDPPRPQIVVVDPPRAGLHPRVVARVAELEARRVVYVSCNPATFARDAADLAARGYLVKRVRPFDMFPHTAHVECVAVLERGEAAP
jgi:23S rRNA (uracil1939-C5)-methyltransferase